MTVLFDNYEGDLRLETGWGFSCLMEGLEKVILFDTGADGRTLLLNMAKVGVDPRKIEMVFLSHEHADHTGGLGALLAENPDITVVLHAAFSSDFKNRLRGSGRRTMEIKEATPLMDGAWSTGVLGTTIREHSLVVETDRELLVVTGCAHPGVENIVAAARRLVKDKPVRVVGGFHMMGAAAAEIRRVAARLKELGVERISPCHCSGDLTRRLMKEAFGDRCSLIGVGSRL